MRRLSGSGSTLYGLFASAEAAERAAAKLEAKGVPASCDEDGRPSGVLAGYLGVIGSLLIGNLQTEVGRSRSRLRCSDYAI